MSGHTFWLYLGVLVFAFIPVPLWATIVAFIVWVVAVNVIYPKEVKRADKEAARR